MKHLQITNFLIGKSLAETIFIGVLAVVVYVKAFPATFHGWGEFVADSQSIAGWAVNNASPGDRVEVQLFIDGKPAGTQVAHLSRRDVVASGWAKDEWRGYNFMLSELAPGPHEARVYALHRMGDEERYTLQMLGDPIKFVIH